MAASPKTILDKLEALAAPLNSAVIQKYAQYPGNVKPRPALQLYWADVEKTGREGGASGERLRYEGTVNVVIIEDVGSMGGDPWGKVNSMIGVLDSDPNLQLSGAGLDVEMAQAEKAVGFPPSQDDNRVDWVAVLLPISVTYTAPRGTI